MEDFAYGDKSEEESLTSDEFEEESSDIEAEEMVRCTCEVVVTYSLTWHTTTGGSSTAVVIGVLISPSSMY